MLFRLGGDEFHGRRVHAVTHARGRGRRVIEDVAQVSIAAGAVDFGSLGKKFLVHGRADFLWSDGLEEAGPARAALELGFRAVEILTTAHALIGSLCVVVVIFVLERWLGAMLARHLELHFR